MSLTSTFIFSKYDDIFANHSHIRNIIDLVDNVLKITMKLSQSYGSRQPRHTRLSTGTDIS